MLGLIQSLIQQRDGGKSSQQGELAGELGSGYDPLLVESLCDEHQQILICCQQLELVVAKGKDASIRKQLRRLDDQVRSHRMREDVALLLFMEHHLEEDTRLAQRLRQGRREREQWRKQVMAFFDKYHGLRLVGPVVEDLRVDLATMGAALVAMMEQEEEELFPLYLQFKGFV